MQLQYKNDYKSSDGVLEDFEIARIEECIAGAMSTINGDSGPVRMTARQAIILLNAYVRQAEKRDKVAYLSGAAAQKEASLANLSSKQNQRKAVANSLDRYARGVVDGLTLAIEAIKQAEIEEK